MQLIITLLLSGVVYTVASPACTDEGVQKCFSYDSRTPNHPFVVTEQDLESFCKSVQCLIDFREICGDIGPGPDVTPMFKQYKIILTELCDEPHRMKQKYLENAKCLNEGVISSGEKCKVGDESIEMGDHDFCEKVEKHLDCSYEVIRKECGDDARDVYSVIYPGLDFYGCKK